MKRIFAAVILVAVCSDAWAKDICVFDSGSTLNFVFRKVKALKPGGAVSLAGISSTGDAVTGSASMTSTGVVRVGVMLHTMASVDAANSLYETLTVDETFAGSGVYDNGDLDTQTRDYKGDAPTTWLAVDCSTVTLP